MKKKIPEEESKFGIDLMFALRTRGDEPESLEVCVWRNVKDVGNKALIMTVEAPGIRDQLIEIANNVGVISVDIPRELQTPVVHTRLLNEPQLEPMPKIVD